MTHLLFGGLGHLGFLLGRLTAGGRLCLMRGSGDCKVPPDVPNAQAALSGLTSFPERHIVTYKCNEGFVKVPGKPDSVICLKGNEWSQIAEFCNRSCDVPTRLLFASLKNPYNRQNYFPVGSIVEYDCRMGYKRDQSLSGNLTCLQNFTWSQPDEFCKKKSCPNPGEIINGRVNIKTDILFGASITFSCNTGYKLVGATSSYCIVSGENVDWSDPLPECKGSSPISKVIPTPQKPTTVAVSGTKAPSTSQKPTTVAVSGTKAPSTPQKPTTVHVPGTKAPSTPQKHTTVIVPATEVASTPQELTTVNFSATEAPLTPKKSTTLNIPATEFPSSPQKPITANVPATEATSTSQKPTKINSSATKTLLIPQKSTLHVPTNPHKPTSNISVMETPSTPQKPITANDLATIAKITPVSNALSAETPLSAAQTPIMANSSVTQAIPKTQRLTTAKASFTQSLPGTQKFTAGHAPVTKSLHTTQRLPSAPISATRSTAVPRATTPFRARSTPKGKGIPSAGVSNIICGLVTGAIITGILILGKIFWDRGKSGTHICNTDSFAYDASSQWLFDLAKEEIRRKCTQVHRPLLVSYKLLEPWTQYMQSCSSFCMLSLSLRCIEMSLKQEETNLS
ncbi:complement decay-accelerating factor isoform X4 [Desmodus rotundus]|uniref:complement decay-accelerating factor isoform X4 n=1 Tax=Desmodus rotundus TaxID=9430 RepID=UPI002380E780|nr:complement decay-accelerating factor isoform X4 [Desmodus rotundus]